MRLPTRQDGVENRDKVSCNNFGSKFEMKWPKRKTISLKWYFGYHCSKA